MYELKLRAAYGLARVSWYSYDRLEVAGSSPIDGIFFIGNFFWCCCGDVAAWKNSILSTLLVRMSTGW